MNTVTTVVRNSVRIIRINKPDKKNAVSVVEFDGIRKILENDKNNDTTKLSIVTGSNDYFTSGLDMNDVFKYIIEKDDTYAEKISIGLRNLIQEIIDYPKLLVGVVNGPAVGIGTTILPFFDYIYASEKATFQSPFVKLGLNVEACSSFTFPMVMNRMNMFDLVFLGLGLNVEACSSFTFPMVMNRMNMFDLVFLGKKIDVTKAKELGLVGQIYKDSDVDQVYDGIQDVTKAKELGLVGQIYKDSDVDQVYDGIQDIAQLPFDTVKLNKKLVMDNFREKLIECNKRECDMLKISLKSPQFLKTVSMFLTRKNKK
ncbi:Enoyl-CoA hydratase/isomerase [Popillia japonica]|uniref:Enoyl-CoA hydratase/isomerase n=1 Tax=Popillia japonica TaxID=7064 RepID=A0AAW1LXF3_POPJA